MTNLEMVDKLIYFAARDFGLSEDELEKKRIYINKIKKDLKLLNMIKSLLFVEEEETMEKQYYNDGEDYFYDNTLHEFIMLNVRDDNPNYQELFDFMLSDNNE